MYTLHLNNISMPIRNVKRKILTPTEIANQQWAKAWEKLKTLKITNEEINILKKAHYKFYNLEFTPNKIWKI